MLYLTRKIGQSIIINDKIEVKVMEISGKQVKIGIEFPKTATVLRKEVYDSIVEQNIASTKSGFEHDNMAFFEAIQHEVNPDKKKNEDKT